MPLHIHKRLDNGGEMGIWSIQEEETWFLEQLQLFPDEWANLQKIKGNGRRLEWLAARQLIHVMSQRVERGALIKDEYGKPHLENSPWDISITHSQGMAAAIAAPRAVGIDLQVFVEKIERLAHKYMRAIESESLQAITRLAHLHVYWCAKEALYKAYGRKLLDFKANIFVTPFAYKKDGGVFTGRVIKDNFDQVFDLKYEVFEDYFLVYTI